MKKFDFIKYVSDLKINMVSFFFWAFLLLFFTDRVANYFIHIPVFVVGAVLLFPLLLMLTQYRNKERKQLYVLVVSFILLTILNSIVFLFNVKNISDALFVVLFFTIYYFYKYSRGKFRMLNIYLFLGMSLLLFSFTFLGKESVSIFSKNPKQVTISKHNGVSLIEEEEEQGTIKRKPNGTIQFDSNKSLDYIEEMRKYHYGMFRVPHVASYFFGFLSLLFFYLFQKKKKWYHLAVAFLLFLVCSYTGSRAIIAAIVGSAIIFLAQRKYLVFLVGLVAVVILLFLTNDYFLQISKNTFFFQYFSLLKTLSHNVTRLSRYRIWYSWWVEVKQFNLLELLIGKSYINALLANQRNLHYPVWFHNDFFNVFYTYGVVGFGLYVGFFVKIYHDFSTLIRKRFFLFVFYFTMVITAFVNGFYYYFPVFILYLFFLMIQNEEGHAG